MVVLHTEQFGTPTCEVLTEAHTNRLLQECGARAVAQVCMQSASDRLQTLRERVRARERARYAVGAGARACEESCVLFSGAVALVWFS